MNYKIEIIEDAVSSIYQILNSNKGVSKMEEKLLEKENENTQKNDTFTDDTEIFNRIAKKWHIK